MSKYPDMNWTDRWGFHTYATSEFFPYILFVYVVYAHAHMLRRQPWLTLLRC